ncbi:hypothetical protein RHMOL_Rhmol08G0192800 [Rhododendron molle]|uniref:Uncharacterized protein n=1 Tax=Rhododendron molle TaxID=49168 RepID=A0ACC0MPY5_RHOML|nr:hypothetical protein RHMOL_Rhmol08G0192800 [Rhododendron molle]
MMEIRKNNYSAHSSVPQKSRVLKSELNELVKDEAIRDRWKSYFEKLLNEKHEGGFGGEEVYVPGENIEYEFYWRIQKFKVVKALKRMKPGKALGPDGIPIEVWKSLGDLVVTWLTKLFNKIIMTRKMPDEWRRSTLVPIYKKKGDIQSCNNYRGIKLMSHRMKLWERVIEHRLRMVTKVLGKHFGFMPGRSTMEANLPIKENGRMAQSKEEVLIRN